MTVYTLDDAVLIYEHRRRQRQQRMSSWSRDGGTYLNRETGRPYRPHHEAERQAVYADVPRATLFKGGEGGGKSVAGIVKSLERLRRGMNGVMGSPDFEHFKKSLWPEFVRWCPWGSVIEEHQRMASPSWQPSAPFRITFLTPDGRVAHLYCGGFDNPESWDGMNVSFFHFDEARRHKTPAMLKVMDARCRIDGPSGEPPAYWLTSTPRKHWMFEYFGPLKEDDAYASFKSKAHVVDLLTADNERDGNLTAGYTELRRTSLTAAEARVLLEAAWEDIDDVDRFLPSMTLWDLCRVEGLPPLTRHDPMVIAMDAAKGRATAASDCFAMVGVSLHPHNRELVVPRFVETWQAKAGGVIDYQGTEDRPGPERRLELLCRDFNVIQVCYDPYQLHDMAMRLSKRGVAWFSEFSQAGERAEADNQMLEQITQRRYVHDGNPVLRAHIDNADRKLDADSRKLRLIKRAEDLKIDAAVALSMSTARLLKLNV